MNGPVHEVQHISRELDPQLAASLPLEDPSEHELPTSQALHLSATAGGPGALGQGREDGAWGCGEGAQHGVGVDSPSLWGR